MKMPCSAGHQCRCQTQMVRYCQTSFLVIGTGPRFQLLWTMRPPPNFSMAPNCVQRNILWIYGSLVYWSWSYCLPIIKMSLLPQNHCCVQPHICWLAVVSKLFIYFFSSDGLLYNFPQSGLQLFVFCGLLLLDSQQRIAFGQTKWRHVSQNMRSVLHVVHTVRVHILVHVNSHQVAYFDMTTKVLTAVGKLAFSIFYNCLINVKSERQEELWVNELWDP